MILKNLHTSTFCPHAGLFHLELHLQRQGWQHNISLIRYNDFCGKALHKLRKLGWRKSSQKNVNGWPSRNFKIICKSSSMVFTQKNHMAGMKSPLSTISNTINTKLFSKTHETKCKLILHCIYLFWLDHTTVYFISHSLYCQTEMAAKVCRERNLHSTKQSTLTHKDIRGKQSRTYTKTNFLPPLHTRQQWSFISWSINSPQYAMDSNLNFEVRFGVPGTSHRCHITPSLSSKLLATSLFFRGEFLEWYGRVWSPGKSPNPT